MHRLYQPTDVEHRVDATTRAHDTGAPLRVDFTAFESGRVTLDVLNGDAGADRRTPVFEGRATLRPSGLVVELPFGDRTWRASVVENLVEALDAIDDLDVADGYDWSTDERVDCPHPLVSVPGLVGLLDEDSYESYADGEGGDPVAAAPFDRELLDDLPDTAGSSRLFVVDVGDDRAVICPNRGVCVPVDGDPDDPSAIDRLTAAVNDLFERRLRAVTVDLREGIYNPYEEFLPTENLTPWLARHGEAAVAFWNEIADDLLTIDPDSPHPDLVERINGHLGLQKFHAYQLWSELLVTLEHEWHVDVRTRPLLERRLVEAGLLAPDADPTFHWVGARERRRTDRIPADLPANALDYEATFSPGEYVRYDAVGAPARVVARVIGERPVFEGRDPADYFWAPCGYLVEIVGAEATGEAPDLAEMVGTEAFLLAGRDVERVDSEAAAAMAVTSDEV